MRRRKLTLLPLVAATYFMVSGGPYGLEELVQDCGYRTALLIIILILLIFGFGYGGYRVGPGWGYYGGGGISLILVIIVILLLLRVI